MVSGEVFRLRARLRKLQCRMQGFWELLEETRDEETRETITRQFEGMETKEAELLAALRRLQK